MSVRLGEILVKESLISQDQLQKALDYQRANGGRLGTCLMKMGFISDDDITGVLSRQYGVPSINLKYYEVDPTVIKLIPQDTAMRYQMVPLSRVGSTLTIAMTDPTNVFAMDDIKFMTGFNVEPVVASEAAIARSNFASSTAEAHERRRAHQGHEGSGREDNGDLELAAEEAGDGPGRAGKGRGRSAHHQAGEPDSDRRRETGRERHPHRAVRKGIARAVPHGRHAASGHDAAAEAERRDHQPHQDHGQAGHQRKAAAARRPHHDQVPQADGKIKELDFRVSTVPTLYGEKIVMRLLDKENLRLDMTKLGFEPESLVEIRAGAFCAVRNGAGHRADRVRQDQHAVFVRRAR